MGIEFRDTAYALGPKCARTIKTNMIFSITLGFQNIPNSKTGPSSVTFFSLAVRVWY
jgi:nucleosome binding factor SPN SPT16 subunit